jgi:trehalose 6-phosphate phosphatase
VRRAPKTPQKKITSIRTASRLAAVFDSWHDISRRVRAAKRIALFLDFDGTLVDFCSRPELVKLSARTVAALRKLAGHRSVRVMIVSGRRHASLLQFIRAPRVSLHGLYGWENEGGMRLSRKTAGKISKARAILAGLPHKAPGIFIEEKGISLAVHFRDASAQAERHACAELRKLLAPLRPHLRIIRAGNVWEVTPVEVRGKGAAVRNMLRELGPSFLPIYVGDDLTDEPAFQATRKGITVLVGSQRVTNAHFWLRNPAQVSIFLERLQRLLA